MSGIIIGGDDMPPGLRQLLSGALGGPPGGEEGNHFMPGDISILAERAVERKRTKKFLPGEFVRFRSPYGMGIRNTGPFVVISQMPTPITAHESNMNWDGQMFSSAQVDLIIGAIMRHHSQSEGVYREFYVWSGMMEKIDLDAEGLELERLGIEGADVPGKPFELMRNEDGPRKPRASRRASEDSPWLEDGES